MALLNTEFGSRRGTEFVVFDLRVDFGESIIVFELKSSQTVSIRGITCWRYLEPCTNTERYIRIR